MLMIYNDRNQEVLNSDDDYQNDGTKPYIYNEKNQEGLNSDDYNSYGDVKFQDESNASVKNNLYETISIEVRMNIFNNYKKN